jgi:hypothetical protein
VRQSETLESIAAAGAPRVGTGGAPSGPPASPQADASATSSTTPASLTVNGNNPAQWPLNQIWNDNLGALFTTAGQSTTIYSTTTVGTTVSGTTTIDYWALIPTSGEYLYTTRDVVVTTATNDNAAPIQPANDDVATSTPEAANDNTPFGTDATTTAP